MKPLVTTRHGQRARRRGDEGSALTEFVLIIPLFILLLFWSEFFVDLGLVKLKAEEAARYAVWEMTAQRDTNEVKDEVISRFRDLSSPADIHNSAPIGARSFKSINISKVDIVENIDAGFEGNLSLGWGNGGGILNLILRSVSGWAGRTANSLVKQMKFDTHREAQAVVQFEVDNVLFRGIGTTLSRQQIAERKIWEVNDPGRSSYFVMKATSPTLLVDTWRAWPGKFGGSSTDVNTDPYETYSRGGSSAPEREVASRMKNMAFFGIQNNFIIRLLSSLITLTGFPKPFGTSHWKDNSGPICMLPGDNAKHSFVPGSGLGAQRIGDNLYPQTPVPVSWASSPENGVDRPRSTVPSYVHTGFWGSEGGMSGQVAAPAMTDQQNPYQAMYKCRDAYYLGSTVPGLKRYGDSQANTKAFPLCK